MRHTLLLVLLLLFLPLAAQQKSWRQFTTRDGLAGNAVYDILKDSHGYLWFATDHGICRFNGYTFSIPVDTNGTRGTSAFIPTEDAQGRIWYSGIDGTLWFVEHDSIHPWKHNRILKRRKDAIRIPDQLAIDEDGTIWLTLYPNGIMRISASGTIDSIQQVLIPTLSFVQIRDKLIYATGSPKNWTNALDFPELYPHDIIQIINGQPRQIVQLELKRPTLNFIQGIWRIGDGFLYDRGETLFFIRHDSVVWQAPTPILAEKMVETADHGILVASPHGEFPGLFYYTSLDAMKRGIYVQLLPGPITAILIDHEGGWWASSTSSGVFYCSNPGLDIYDTDSGLPSDDIVSITSDQDQIVYTGHRPSAVFKINAYTNRLETLAVPKSSAREILDMHFDKKRNHLWYGPVLVQYEILPAQSHASWYGPDARQFIQIPSKTIAIGEASGHVYSASHAGFYEIDPVKQEAILFALNDTSVSHNRTFKVCPDRQGNIWVATIDGLRLWKDGHYVKPPFTHPALRFRASDIAFTSDDKMIIGFAGGGILIRQGEEFIHLTRNDGLISDHVKRISVSQDDDLYICTNSGLNRISTAHSQWRIETVSIKEGLPSNEVNDVTTLNKEVWIATNAGLVRMREAPQVLKMSPPAIDRIRVNRLDIASSDPTTFDHEQNLITIRYHALSYRADKDITYRYRLLGADTGFAITSQPMVEFAQLAHGNYTFEVQARNADGTWTGSTSWVFRIRPAWYQTWWFRIAILVLIATGLYFFLRVRINLIKDRVQIQHRIRDLEAAALRAQMNPHFIFNCLVSIQQFIIENNKESATSYLAKFARLVRLALHGSVDGKHSLTEEIEMLENYLALEQLRFKHRFNYSITVSPEIDTNEITIPPLLVQPLVENAIVHGMKDKRGDGKIEIAFEKKGPDLHVSVVDNGKGLSENGTRSTVNGDPSTEHRSVGMMLTRRRLEVLGEGKQETMITHINLKDDMGNTIGSKAEIVLPLDKE